MRGGKIITFIVAGLGLAIIIWLTKLDGWEYIAAKLKRPSIGYTNLKSPSKKEIETGSQLRFALVNTKSDYVFWLFDEDEDNIKKGGVEFDYTFGYDEDKGAGMKATHRVDAFFRKGDTYKTIMTRVDVYNRSLKSDLNEHKNELKVSLKPAMDINYRLTKISVAHHNAGQFSETGEVGIKTAATLSSIDPSENFTIFDLDLTPLGTKTLVESSKSKDNWYMYTFTDDSKGDVKVLVQHAPQSIQY